MRLIDLNPKYQKGGTLSIDCPHDPKSHRVKIDARWQCKGNFENMTTLPKTIICVTCDTPFGIRGGEIIEILRLVRRNDEGITRR